MISNAASFAVSPNQKPPAWARETLMAEEYRDWQDGVVKVVKNREGICSIWPAERDNAPGWEDVGISGSKEECLSFIRQHCDPDCRC
jgi:uncharacterized protein YbdZ (MbtH family)